MAKEIAKDTMAKEIVKATVFMAAVFTCAAVLHKFAEWLDEH